MPRSCREEKHWRSVNTEHRTKDQKPSVAPGRRSFVSCVVKTGQGRGIGTENKKISVDSKHAQNIFQDLKRTIWLHEGVCQQRDVMWMIHCGPAVIEMGERGKRHGKGDALRNQK